MGVLTIPCEEIAVNPSNEGVAVNTNYEAKIVEIFRLEDSEYSDEPAKYIEFALVYVMKNLSTGEILSKTESVSMNFKTPNTKIFKILSAILGSRIHKKHLPKDDKGNILFDPDKLLNQSYTIKFSYNKEGKVFISERLPLDSSKSITKEEAKNYTAEPWAVRRKKDVELEELRDDINLLDALQTMQNLADGTSIDETEAEPDSLPAQAPAPETKLETKPAQTVVENLAEKPSPPIKPAKPSKEKPEVSVEELINSNDDQEDEISLGVSEDDRDLLNSDYTEI